MPRWRNTHPPNRGSAVFISGVYLGRHTETRLGELEIEDITLNAGSRADVAGDRFQANVPRDGRGKAGGLAGLARGTVLFF